MPTIAEIEHNIDVCAEGEPEYIGRQVIIHRIVAVDEIAVEGRPRYDDKSNKVLGVGRECSDKVPLELNTQADLEVFFNALDAGDISLATEVRDIRCVVQLHLIWNNNLGHCRRLRAAC
jgi:hypothetical protein